MNNLMDSHVVYEQGWNSDTLLILASEFIHEKKLDEEWEAFLQKRAEEENRGGS